VADLTEAQAIAAFETIVTGLEKQRGYQPGELLEPNRAVQVGLKPGGGIVVQRQGTGVRWPSGVPVLCRDYGSWTTETRWAIVWEEGPYEWVHYLDGGIEEEFGFRLTPIQRPAGVFTEPIESFSLGLYRED
jgi:hypothetical protein